jgi:hypothetical protein
MKMSIIARFFIFTLIAAAFACGKKSDEHDHAHGDDHESAKEWKEMDDFHMVMAEAFHPYKDSSDLKPAKEKAGELASAAAEWKNSDFPEAVQGEKIGEKLDKLSVLSQEFSASVATASDEAVAAKLTALHDLFHEIQNDFYGGAGEGHHHDGHEHH